MSWIIRNRRTGLVLFETWDISVPRALNRQIYEAIPIAQYLGELNARIRQEARS